MPAGGAARGESTTAVLERVEARCAKAHQRWQEGDRSRNAVEALSNCATSLHAVGEEARKQRIRDLARLYLSRALEIRMRVAPGSPEVAESHEAIAHLAWNEADYALAGEHARAALAIRETLDPASLETAANLHTLGAVASRQGDSTAALDYEHRALAIREKRAPRSLAVANSLNSLGATMAQRGDMVSAHDYFLRAVRIQQKWAPNSLSLAMSLGNAGLTALRLGDAAKARDLMEKSLAMRRRLAPGSREIAESLRYLSALEEEEGDLAAARDLLAEALAIEEEHAPGSIMVAGDLSRLGDFAERGGDLIEAEKRYAAAWRIVRAQRLAIAGDEAGRAFTAEWTEGTRLVSLRVRLGRKEEAFRTFEEARAQGLLNLIAQSGIDQGMVDPGLWKRYEEGERAVVAAGLRLAEVGEDESGTAAPGGKTAREEALASYTRARVESDRLLSEVRRSVPGLEARKFSFDQARRALPARSVFVAWSVGEKRSVVFVIPSDPAAPIGAEEIEAGVETIGAQVSALRDLMGAGPAARGIGGVAAAAPGRAEPSPIVAGGGELYRTLLPEAARRAVEAADRVVLSPDGPLWDLPFAALNLGTDEEPVWLGLSKPLSYTSSLTVLAILREGERRAPPGGVLLVGDPEFARADDPVRIAQAGGAPGAPGSGEAIRGARALLAGGVVPERLPATATEVTRIGAIYGAAPLLGPQATEGAVRAQLPQASIVHLATHGLFHPRLAMSSGVLLAPPPAGAPEIPADDGALQAWEFGRTLPLAADLVVLSACETGRGEQAMGEGLVGLTRAILGAGARSVVASHWMVADESTAELMVAFHGGLREGMPIDEALHEAMRATAADATTRHPFHWAPFFLTGDAEVTIASARVVAEPPGSP